MLVFCSFLIFSCWQEYDPETAFAPESPKRDDDAPYDPEDAEDLMADTLDSSEVQELAEKKVMKFLLVTSVSFSDKAFFYELINDHILHNFSFFS